jgi:hypothetical protein
MLARGVRGGKNSKLIRGFSRAAFAFDGMGRPSRRLRRNMTPDDARTGMLKIICMEATDQG